jgi:hypothetical protein
VVQSNIPLDIDGIDQVNVVELDDYQLLPFTGRTVIWENRDHFDMFAYGENDHLFKEHHFDNHIRYSNILPNNKSTLLYDTRIYRCLKCFSRCIITNSWLWELA